MAAPRKTQKIRPSWELKLVPIPIPDPTVPRELWVEGWVHPVMPTSALETCGTRSLRSRSTAANRLGDSVSEVAHSTPHPTHARVEKPASRNIPPPQRGRGQSRKNGGRTRIAADGCLQEAVDKQLSNEAAASQSVKVKATVTAEPTRGNVPQQSDKDTVVLGSSSGRQGSRVKTKGVATERRGLRLLRETDMPAGRMAQIPGSQRDVPERKSVRNLRSSTSDSKPRAHEPANQKWNESIPGSENIASDGKENYLPPPRRKRQTQGGRPNRISKSQPTTERGGEKTRVTRAQTRKRCIDMSENQVNANIYTNSNTHSGAYTRGRKAQRGNPQQGSSSQAILPRYSAKRLLSNIAMAEGICQPIGLPKGTLTADEDCRVFSSGAGEDSLQWKLNKGKGLPTHRSGHEGDPGEGPSAAYPSWEDLTAWQKECRDLCIESLSPGEHADHDALGEEGFEAGIGRSTAADVGII